MTDETELRTVSVIFGGVSVDRCLEESFHGFVPGFVRDLASGLEVPQHLVVGGARLPGLAVGVAYPPPTLFFPFLQLSGIKKLGYGLPEMNY